MKKLSVSSCFFLACILICFAFSFVPFEDDDQSENRRKASFPTEFSEAFPAQFDAFYQDHFPFRSFLIKKFYTLRKSIKDNPKVIIGADDWIFLNSSPFDTYAKTDNSLGDFTGKTLLDETELAEYEAKMKKQKNYFDKHGIRFLIMIPPNKMSVYPELAPKAYRKLKAPYSRYEQTEEAIRKAGIPFINLKKLFEKEKGTYPLYYKTDTHWNDFGAYTAFQHLMNILMKKVPAVESVVAEPSPCGDNYRMSGAAEECSDTHYKPVLTFKSAEEQCSSPEPGYMICTNDTAPYKEHVLIGRDSFTERLVPYFGKTFKKTTFIWSGKISDEQMFDIIKTEKPDIVLYNYAERNLSQTAKDVPEETKGDK